MKKGLLKKAAAGIMALIMGVSLAPAVNVNAEEISDETVISQSADIVADEEMDAAYVESNYAKLLQYSLYFYDANMCGTNVNENTLLSWRGDCHTNDRTTYRRNDGVTVNVNVTGGFHDAGDHVKFGLPEAFAAFTLGMSYDTEKAAYQAASQAGHLETITTYFADYLYNCAVLDASGKVEAYVVQVGDGNSDHSYWGSPEKQTTNRPISFATSKAPATDIVSLSAAALVLQYSNFGDAKYLEMAKKLFTFAQENNKAVCTVAGSFYSSSAWQDDYCLAAILLYNVTGYGGYLNEYNQYKNHDKSRNSYWALCWDNVGPATAYYAKDINALSNFKYIGGSSLEGYFKCLDDWGSLRYNTGVQYMALLTDKLNGNNNNLDWAKKQMAYILGNNSLNKCFVIGYNNQYSAKYPHHRAASGYTGSVQGTKAQKYELLGALVGGPSKSGFYEDTASNYQTNEVALDYNANLVAAAAALYSRHIGQSGQYIDSYYYSDASKTKFLLNGINLVSNRPEGFTVTAAVDTNIADQIQYAWYVANEDGTMWLTASDFRTGAGTFSYMPPANGKYTVICKARIGNDASTELMAITSAEYHKYIKGICQIPYTGAGGGYLIGFETFDNPNQRYRYEMLILDCCLLAAGKDAWVYTTGQNVVPENCLWTVWQPQYGYYWTLFRLYDENNNLLDEACYGFVNAY